MLKVYVINLESSTERWARVSKRLSALNVEFERFSAIDGREKPHPLFAQYNETKCRRYRRKKLSGGELGCFASHYLLWEHCVALNQPLVVMEDDVYITDMFAEACSEAEALIESLRYIRLAGTSLHRRPYKVIRKVGNLELVDHIRGPSGTLCYVIHPSAAKALLEHAQCWYLAVDDFMDRYWHHGVDCFSLMPFSVLVADNGSDIKRLSKRNMSLGAKLILELNGRFERLRRACYRHGKRKIPTVELK